MRTLVVFVACFSVALAQGFLPNVYEPPAEAPAAAVAPEAAPAAVPAAAPDAVPAAAPAAPAAPAVQDAALEPIKPVGPGCPTPGGGELTTIMQNIAGVVLNTVMTDRYSKGAIGFMASPAFQQTINNLQRNSDFQMLSDYLCKEMYMDVDYFINWMNDWVANPPAPRRISGVPRGGVNELLDLSDFSPSLMNEMVPPAIFDQHYANVFMAYRSPAFDRMIGYVENSRSFKRLEDQLKMFEIDIHEAGDFIKEILYQYRRNRRQNRY